MKHLLVTNDFPPKLGGIQSYLWELWRRMPPDEVTVLTTPWPGDAAFDAAQAFPVVRSRHRILLPVPSVRAEIDRLAEACGAELVVLDPAVPLGALGSHLDLPYAVVLHGAEVTLPGRSPGAASVLRRVLLGADEVITGGGYPADEAERIARRGLPITLVPPGVDPERFRPTDAATRAETRARHGLPADGLVVLGLSRLVPRKGFDVAIGAVARLAARYPDLCLAVAGQGRDRRRLGRMADRTGAPVRFLGRVDDTDLAALHAAADVFIMVCRNRWMGLEQEGFGIVFLEAAASGVPQIAGRSGGSHEAVADEETGLIVDDPADVTETTAALDRLLGDEALRARLGGTARARAVESFGYDQLAERLGGALGVGR